MPDLNEDEPVRPSTDAPTPRPVGPREVEALHAIDELIGNRDKIGRSTLGEVRGIVLDTLNAWHAKLRERQQLVAGGRPSPLPSELLESADGGQGIAAFVLSAEALDRLPVLMRDTVPPGGFLPAAPEEPRVASMRGRRDRARDHAVRNESEAADLRRQLDEALADADRYANALTTLEAERDDARRQLVEQGQAAEEQADALRAEVARLSGLLDLQQNTTSHLRELLDAERARAERAEGLTDGPLNPIAEDPRRPRLDHFPDDAILLTYREVRQLLALHIEAVADSIQSAAGQARAMREGETPLRLAEVLDR